MLLVALGLTAAPTEAAVVFVVTKSSDTNDGTCNTDCSLREAVGAAASISAGATIRLGARNHVLTGSPLVLTNIVTIEGVSGSTVSRAPGTTGRIFDVMNTATFRDIEVTGGLVPHSGSMFDDNGGGIRNQGTLTLEGVNVHHNVANDEGGGIWSNTVAATTLVIRNSRIHSNEAETRMGGGVHAVAVTIEDSEITDNDSTGVSGSGGGVSVLAGEMVMRRTLVARNAGNLGGGVYGNSAVSSTIEDTRIEGNTASGGGGVSWAPGQLMISRTTIASNEASAGGGAATSSGSIELVASTVSGNDASGTGGGLFANGGGYTLHDSTVSGNLSFGGGGGVLLNNTASASINDSTITDNTADWDMSNGASDDGGGVHVGPSASMTMTGSILAGNHDDSSTTSHLDCSGALGATYTIFGDTTGCSVTGTNNQTADPLLGGLNDNGGPTQTHTISAGSPAHDANDAANCGLADQRGAPRPDTADCDAGSYELVTCQGVTANVIGTSGDDTLEATSGDDGVLGFEGNDTITTNGGADTVCAGDGNDVVNGGDGDDDLYGEAGNDKLYGEDGADTLNGGAGKKDKCYGGPGPDTFVKCETKKQQGVV